MLSNKSQVMSSSFVMVLYSRNVPRLIMNMDKLETERDMGYVSSG
jgi:hypothetical protein